MCGTSIALRASDVSEILEELYLSKFIVYTMFEREDTINFPKFCELFLRVAYFKFKKSKESGDQVFT